MLSKSMTLFIALFSLGLNTFALPISAEVLRAGVEEEDYRIAPAKAAKDEAAANPLRIARAPADDDSDMEKPVADQTQLKGLLDTNEFKPDSFELGADRESQEMVLAWERWHHQLSAAMWQRWFAINHYRGRALMLITVTKDHHITAECLKRRGSAAFEATILQAINSLDTNPGLTFPAKSQRDKVTFRMTMTAGNVPAGYSWDKRDFETVRKDD